MDSFLNLRLFNMLMGFLHLGQGMLMLIVSNDFSLPVLTNYLQFDETSMRLAPVSEQLTDLPLAPLIALFLVLSSIAHFTLILPGVYSWYRERLKKGINYARWYEYAVSSSVMIVVISMLVGVYDLSLLILMFFLNMMMIFWGLMMERHNQLTRRTDWLPFVIGCVAGAIVWVVIALHLLGSGSGENGVPAFVYWIFLSLFVFFNSFAVNMFLQYKKVGAWRDYVFGEKVYILLSLLAKSALAWQVFAGTLRPV
ncbi:MAG: heliorhodopsin HeR [Candidatus Dojkabacteria bacterium]|nr:heliorhodopsin HeR [Candidatus Dojkabacteria bacterium]